MTLPTPILDVREIGDGEWPYWLASSADGSSLDLELGEVVLCTGTTRVMFKKPIRVTLNFGTTIQVTDRPLVLPTME